MSIKIKVLVDLNYEKYVVLIDSEYTLIRFKSVLTEIIRQTKQNVSFDSHLFELYDLDFEEYVLITNFDQIIDNLSRIRVKPRDTYELTNSSIDETLNQLTVEDNDPSPQNSLNTLETFSQLKSNSVQNNLNNPLETNRRFEKSLTKTIDSINNLVKEKNVNKQRVSANEDLISCPIDDTFTEPIVSESIATCGPISGAVNTNAINYLDLKLMDNYGYSADCRHLSHKTYIDEFLNKPLVTIRYRLDDSEAIQYLLELFDVNRRCFQLNQTNGAIKWKRVSDQMISNGFENWSPEQCRDGSRSALELYKKTLHKCPDMKIANKVNSLFSRMHSFDPKFIVDSEEFDEIRRLRDLFDEKTNDLDDESEEFLSFPEDNDLSSDDNSIKVFSTAVETNYNISLGKKSQNFGSNSVQNEDLINFSMTESSDSRSTSSFGNLSKTRIRTKTKTQTKSQTKPINYLGINSSKHYSKLSYNTIVVDFGNQSVIAIKYRSIDYKAIKLLLELLHRNRSLFQSNSSNDLLANSKWKVVSEQLIIGFNGYDQWIPDKCREGFNIALDLYKKTLDKCPDFETADAVNPLFSAIHSFDLKFIISLTEFKEILELRQSFEKKISETFGANQQKCGSNVRKFGSNLSLASIGSSIGNRRGGIGGTPNRSQIDSSKLYKISNLNSFCIKSFKELAKCVENITEQFGHVSYVRQFWDFVSNQMIAKGYKTFDSTVCRNIFREYVNDYYGLVLFHSTDAKSASKLYPLFQCIHSMDLSQYLTYPSYQKIKELREKFAKNN